MSKKLKITNTGTEDVAITSITTSSTTGDTLTISDGTGWSSNSTTWGECRTLVDVDDPEFRKAIKEIIMEAMNELAENQLLGD